MFSVFLPLARGETTDLHRFRRRIHVGIGRVEIIHVGEEKDTSSFQLDCSQGGEIVVVSETHAILVAVFGVFGVFRAAKVG